MMLLWATKEISNTTYIAIITGKLGHCEYDIGNFDKALNIVQEISDKFVILS